MAAMFPLFSATSNSTDAMSLYLALPFSDFSTLPDEKRQEVAS